MFNNLFDSHVHSKNSPDGFDTVVSLCDTAVKSGLMGISITDHCEIGDPEYDNLDDVRRSLADADRAAQAYNGQLRVTRGIELGQAHQHKARTDELFAQEHFDFVIGSLHKMLGRPDFFYLNYADEDIHRLMREYYNELIEMARFGRFDVIGHINYPIRYIPPELQKDFNLNDFDDQVDELLREVAAQGKGIEINTSGLRRKENQTYPPFRYIKRFRELGGEIVTIGSDAHIKGDLGAHIDAGMRLLLDAGFSYFAFFRSRQPVMLKLI